jgi:predicted secreted protein
MPWVFKLDESGNQVWQHVARDLKKVRLNAVDEAVDGSIYVAGAMRQNAFGETVSVFKLDRLGKRIWQKSIDESHVYNVPAIQATTDGGVVVASRTRSRVEGNGTDALVFKLDANGDLIWDRTYGGSGHDGARDINATKDGGFIVAGSNHSNGAEGSHYWVFKLDAEGNQTAEWTFGDGNENEPKNNGAYSIQETTEGDFIVAGNTSSIERPYDTDTQFEANAGVFKLDAEGNKIWKRSFGGEAPDYAIKVRDTGDSGFVVCGVTRSHGPGAPHAWVFKLDSQGSQIWERTFGGPTYDLAKDIQVTKEGGYLVVGTFGYSAWVAKLDENGEIHGSVAGK